MLRSAQKPDFRYRKGGIVLGISANGHYDFSFIFCWSFKVNNFLGKVDFDNGVIVSVGESNYVWMCQDDVYSHLGISF